MMCFGNTKEITVNLGCDMSGNSGLDSIAVQRQPGTLTVPSSNPDGTRIFSGEGASSVGWFILLQVVGIGFGCRPKGAVRWKINIQFSYFEFLKKKTP